MAQLTGQIQGTSTSDSYLAEILRDDAVIVDDVLTGIAATDLILHTLGGADTIDAIVDLARVTSDVPAVEGIGVENAIITTGDGSDRLTVVSNAISSLFDPTGGGTGTDSKSTGLFGSNIDMGNGNDVVSISGLAVVVNDDISDPFADDGPSVLAQSFGVVETKVRLGSGSDEISINVDAPAVRSSGEVATADVRGVSQGKILGERGVDSISITAKATASGRDGGVVRTYGAAFGSTIDGGYGQDTITIESETRGGNTTQAVGVGFGTAVEGAAGRDVITISAKHLGVGDDVNVKGVLLGAFVKGGTGADIIEVNAEGSAGRFGSANVFGIEKANIDGGNGSDIIDINVSGDSNPLANSTYLGVFQAMVAGGNGSDTININVTGSTSNSKSIGVRQGTLDGGKGRDTFVVQGVNFDLDDAIISGGDGADVFDTGIGLARISGNGGNDLIKLDFFNSDTMSIELLGNAGIEIRGTQDKLGNINTWTQTITDVEQYEVAGISYNAAEVVSLLG